MPTGWANLGTTMGRTGRIVLIACVLNVICVSAFYFISKQLWYDESWNTGLERRVRDLERSANTLETLVAREHIITKDRAGDSWDRILATGTNSTNRFKVIRDHHKIADASKPVAAWVSDWTPREEMLKFDALYIVPHVDTGEIELVAKPRVADGIDITLQVTVLFRDFTKIRDR
jgi:hypothetical protein